MSFKRRNIGLDYNYTSEPGRQIYKKPGGIGGLIGTGSNNEVAIFSGSFELTGSSALTFDGSTLILSGNLDVTGQLLSGSLAMPNLTGTPADNQLAVWISANTLEGDSNLIWDGSELVVTGNIELNGTVDGLDLQTHDHSGVDQGGTVDHVDLSNKGTNTHTQIDSHITSTSNPHSVTFTQAVTADAGTDISAAECETLTDTSDADSLHTHGTYDTHVGASAPHSGHPDINGTPVDNQIAVWTDSNTLEGDSNLTWDGTALSASDIGMNATIITNIFTKIVFDTSGGLCYDSNEEPVYEF